MMDQNVFNKVIAERIMSYMPPIYADYVPKIEDVDKVNETKTALSLEPADMQPYTPVPMVYLDDMYELFSENEDLDEVMAFIANIFMNNIGRVPKTAGKAFDFSKHTDRIVVQLIDSERNKRLLETLPHMDVCGMAAIYRVVMRCEDGGFDSVIVNESILQDIGLEIPELHSLAVDNTREILEPEIISMGEGVCMVTNRYRTFGASSMMIDEVMNEVSERLDHKHFYIVPCSMHEFMAVAIDGVRLESLMQILQEGNRDFTMEKDILSNEIYEYDTADHRISKPLC